MTNITKEEPPDKPLKGKKYYLDLRKPIVEINQLKKDIVLLGGQVEKFLSKHIDCVITDIDTTDNLFTKFVNSQKVDQIEYPLRVKLPLSRGQVLLLKSIGKNVEGCSDVLANARLWGIKVFSQTQFLLQLEKLKAHYKVIPKKDKKTNTLRVLNGSYIKYEDVLRKFKVHYKQFATFPALTITKNYLGSPFDEIQNVNCETKQNRLKQNTKNKLGKNCVQNYCECCKLYYTNMEVHLKSLEHERFANNEKNYENVQSLIASLETLEALIANIKPENEDQETPRSSRQIITNNEVNESQSAGEIQNKGTPACVANGDSFSTLKFISNTCVIAQTKIDGDDSQTKECNTVHVLEQEPSKTNLDKFTLETQLNAPLDTKLSMSVVDTNVRTPPNEEKNKTPFISTKKIEDLTLQPCVNNVSEIISALDNTAQESGCVLHKQENCNITSNVKSHSESNLRFFIMNDAESNDLGSKNMDYGQSADGVSNVCNASNQNNGHESDFDWDFDVEVDAKQNEGSNNVSTLDFSCNNNNDDIENEGWEIFKESILENAVHNLVPELSDLDICLPESESDIKCGYKLDTKCDDLQQKTELKTGTSWCTFSVSESSEILELKNIETICKKLEAETHSVDVKRKGGDNSHETDSEIEIMQEPERDLIVSNRSDNCFIPIIPKFGLISDKRPHSCPVDATQRTPLDENRPNSCPAEEELSTTSTESTPNGDLEIEIVRSNKVPVSFLRKRSSSQELGKTSLTSSYDGDKLIETFLAENEDSSKQKLLITLKCKNHYWSASESLTPWRVHNSGDLKLQFRRSDLDNQSEIANENNVEWRVRTSGDCKLTLYTMKRKGYSKKENINVFYPKCKKRKLNL